MAEQPVKQGSDEIDLGKLFELIGNGIKSALKGITRFFSFLFDLVVRLLLVLRRYAIHLVIIVLISGVIGYFLDQNKPPTFEAKMVVEPNFNSAQQLYNNIGFYDDLARSNDTVSLAKSLGITSEEAAKIEKIEIDSYSDDNQKIKLFDQFIRNLDSSTVKTINIEEYLSNFNSLNARFHRITLTTTDRFLPKKVQPSIVGSISNNNYFEIQKKASDENLALQERLYAKQLSEIDSLIHFTQRVTLLQAENPMQGTNISMAEAASSDFREIALIKEREAIKGRILRLNTEKANKESILNVISNFPDQGAEKGGFWDRYLFVVPTASLLFFFMLLILIGLNKFLLNYQKEKA